MTHYEPYNLANRLKKPVILIAIIYSLVKFLNHLIIFPDYALSRLISGSALIALIFILTRFNLSARVSAIVLPLTFVFVELTVVLLTGGDRLTYIFFIGTGLLSLLFVDTFGLAVKMLITCFTVLFILFGLDMRILWVDAPITDEIYNFLGTFVMYVILFVMSKFSMTALMGFRRMGQELKEVMLDSAPNVIVVFDKDGNVVDVNQAALEFYNMESKQEYISGFLKTLPEFQPNGEESAPFMLNFFRSTIKLGKPTVFNEWMMQSTTGEPRPIDVTIVPIKIDGKDCVVIHTVDLRERAKLKELQEIEWQRAQDDKMREAEQKAASHLRQIYDANPIPSSMWSLDLKPLDCNEAMVKMLELNGKNDFIDKFITLNPDFQPCGRSTAEKIADVVRQTLKNGYHHYEWVFLSTRGEKIIGSCVCVLVDLGDEKVLSVHFQDLREIHSAIQKEREAEKRAKVLLDSSPTACFVLDENRQAIGCNQAAIELFVKNPREALAETYPESSGFRKCVPNCQGCDLYGHSGCPAREMLIRDNRKIFPGYDTHPEVIEQMLKEGTALALETGKRQISEFEYLTLYGEAIPVEITVVALLYRDGYGLAIYVRDLREMRLMQSETIRREIAENESLAKSQFLARMSHEIRTPMNAILGMTELVLRENIPAQTREQAEIIKQSGNHLLSIINDILDLSKIESGKLELIEAEYLPASVINDIVNIIKVRLPGRKLRFILNIGSSIPHGLWGDSVRVYQIIMNLLGNAVKYTETGFVALDMTAERNGDTANLLIKVRDSGKGIKENDLSELFGEFVRLDTDANAGIEGTGLGLAITRSLIQHMGGTIEVESEYGVGSTFSVTLPQLIKDHENMAAVVSPEEKPVIVFERRKHCVESIIYTMEDLGVPYLVVETPEQFHHEMQSEKYAFAFVSEKLYDDFCPSEFGAQTKIILISQSDDGTAPKDRGFPVLQTPIYCLAVAPLLNNTVSDHSYIGKNLHHFTAPTAKVLIVDDVQVNLKVADGLLKPYQMEVTLCENGQEAIDAIKAEEFDLVLMDYMMPVMSGVDAVKIIRELEVGKELPIIALTANAIVGAKEMFLQTGFDDFISKPIEVARLNDIVAKWVPSEKQCDFVPVAEETQAVPLYIRIDGIDTVKGLALSGGNIPLYLDLIATFGVECPKKLDELTRCLEAEDIPLYTIHVHALKTACANIGADAISKEAENLENAGDRRYIEFIRKHHIGFAENLARLLSDIKIATTRKPSDVICDNNAVFDRLAELKTAIENYDVAAIDKISENMQDFTLHPTYGETVSEILRLTFISKYKQADALINNILGRKH